MHLFIFFSDKKLIGIDIQSYETGSDESHKLLLAEDLSPFTLVCRYLTIFWKSEHVENI